MSIPHFSITTTTFVATKNCWRTSLDVIWWISQYAIESSPTWILSRWSQRSLSKQSWRLNSHLRWSFWHPYGTELESCQCWPNGTTNPALAATNLTHASSTTNDDGWRIPSIATTTITADSHLRSLPP